MESKENLKTNIIDFDPVCSMKVDPELAGTLAAHEGYTYYFCAEGCRKTFEANPGRYSNGNNPKRSGSFYLYSDSLFYC